MSGDNRPVELEIRHFKLVEAIAEEGTMTRAASRLHISQSALSHQLTGLESGLEVSLFRRVPRGMHLTDAGEKLLVTARSVLRDVREVQAQFDARSIGEKGLLRISTECYTCYHWLPARLKSFHTEWPQVEVRIDVESTRRPLEALLAGRLDLAIVSARPRKSGFASHALFDDELVVIVSPQHRLSARPWIRAADFAGERLITYSVDEADLSLFTEVLNPARVRPAQVTRVELTEAIIEMVKANLGIAVLARWAVFRHLNPATLKALPLTARGFHRTWHAVTLRLLRQPRHVDAFIDLLASQGALV
jgi:LysR family transcriptional regulator for metE and metH